MPVPRHIILGIPWYPDEFSGGCNKAFFNGHVFPFFLEPSRLGSRAQKKKSLFGTVGYVTGLTSFFWCCSCQLCDGFQHVCVGSRSLDEPETRLPELCSKLVVLIEIEVC